MSSITDILEPHVDQFTPQQFVDCLLFVAMTSLVLFAKFIYLKLLCPKENVEVFDPAERVMGQERAMNPSKAAEPTQTKPVTVKKQYASRHGRTLSGNLLKGAQTSVHPLYSPRPSRVTPSNRLFPSIVDQVTQTSSSAAMQGEEQSKIEEVRQENNAVIDSTGREHASLEDAQISKGHLPSEKDEVSTDDILESVSSDCHSVGTSSSPLTDQSLRQNVDNSKSFILKLGDTPPSSISSTSCSSSLINSKDISTIPSSDPTSCSIVSTLSSRSSTSRLSRSPRIEAVSIPALIKSVSKENKEGWFSVKFKKYSNRQTLRRSAWRAYANRWATAHPGEPSLASTLTQAAHAQLKQMVASKSSIDSLLSDLYHALSASLGTLSLPRKLYVSLPVRSAWKLLRDVKEKHDVTSFIELSKSSLKKLKKKKKTLLKYVSSTKIGQLVLLSVYLRDVLADDVYLHADKHV